MPPVCALSAMAWPLRRYNPRLPLSAQLNIGGPLLSRFDIIILLLDQLSQTVTASIHCCFGFSLCAALGVESGFSHQGWALPWACHTARPCLLSPAKQSQRPCPFLSFAARS